jgi:hypothetical protein
MPDFYAKKVLDDGFFCIGPNSDKILAPIFKKFGFCKSMKDYGHRLDQNGNPLIEDCQKV